MDESELPGMARALTADDLRKRCAVRRRRKRELLASIRTKTGGHE